MSSSREGPNPLRPYYIPPSIGLGPGESANASSAPHAASPVSSRTRIGGSARDLFSDIDYGNYLEASPSVSDWFRDLLDRAVWKYSSVLMAQPFDVAKTILQVYVVPDDDEYQNTTVDRRRPNHQFQDDFSDQVCSFRVLGARSETDHVFRTRSRPTMRVVISHQLLPPPPRPRLQGPETPAIKSQVGLDIIRRLPPRNIACKSKILHR